MKNRRLGLIAPLVLTCLISGAALAGTVNTFDDTLDIPFTAGSGNSNEHFAISTYTEGNEKIELGLKGKLRFLGDVTPIGSDYYFDVGSLTPGLARWNWDYSVDLVGRTLANTSIIMTVDFKPVDGNLDWATVDINLFAPPTTTNVQDSQNLGFAFWSAFPGWQAFDENTPGDFHFTLTARDGSPTGTILAQTAIDVHQTAVPLPSAALMGLGLLGGLGVMSIRRRRRLTV